MPLQGDLKEFGIPEIFQLLEQQAKTGCLCIQTDSGEIEVYFQEGKIAGALRSGRSPAEQLLSTLETMGFLSGEEARKIRDQQKKDLRSLPEVLGQLGVLEIREFHILLRERVEEILFPMFNRRKGRFSFVQDKTLSSEWSLNDPLSVEPIILEGLRQSDEWPMLKKRVGSFQEVPKRQLVFGQEKGWRSAWKAWVGSLLRGRWGKREGDVNNLSDLDVVPKDEPSLSSAEEMVYNMVDGTRNVGEIISSLPLGAHSASKAFLALLDRGWVRFDKAAEVGKEGDAEAWRGGLVKGALLLVGLILLVFSVSFITRPQHITWVQGSFREGLVPTYRLLNSHQRERTRKAIELYQEEHDDFPPGLSTLVQEHLLLPEDLSLWGNNRFTYHKDPEAGYRLLIIPSQE